MTQVLQSGRWRTQALSRKKEGHIEFALSAKPGVGGSVQINGAQGRARQVGNMTVLPLTGLEEGDYAVSVRVGEGDAPFALDETVSLSVRVAGSSEDYLIREIPVGGRLNADVLIVSLGEDDSIRMRPAPKAPESTGLGGWIANLLTERGSEPSVDVATFYVDTSASMERHSQAVDDLKDFVDTFSRATRSDTPAWRMVDVGGVPNAGVGAVPELSPELGKRIVVITDAPLGYPSVDSLVLGDPEVARYLGGNDPRVFGFEGLPEGGTDEAVVHNDPELLKRLTDLAQWISKSTYERRTRE